LVGGGLAAGQLTYQASPCRHGRSTLRCAANGNCVECHEGGNAGLRAHGLLAETAAILRNILSAVYYPREFDALGRACSARRERCDRRGE
jgi:hypothetical protein